jgi:hypothetical protein
MSSVDFWLAVAILAAVPFWMAAYGGHVAAESISDSKRRLYVRLKFWGVGLLGLIVAFAYQYRITGSDEARQKATQAWQSSVTNQLNVIRDNPAYSKEQKQEVDKLQHEVTQGLPKKEGPPFSVSVEWAKFSIGGKGYGTNFWIDYQSRDECNLAPIQAIYFIRIKNLRRDPVTVIGYSVDVGGIPLVKAMTKIGVIVGIPVGETIFGAPLMNRIKPGDPLNFGQGPGFSIVQIPLDKSDFSHGLLLQLDLIENLLKAPLPPNVPIRGWAFFQSPNENAFTLAGPGHITLETDDSRTYSYAFDLRNPHSELDMLDRTITMKSFVDLSGCKRP